MYRSWHLTSRGDTVVLNPVQYTRGLVNRWNREGWDLARNQNSTTVSTRAVIRVSMVRLRPRLLDERLDRQVVGVEIYWR